ncbi:hypothetical protein FLONG3_4648 [Fusarium longipes]|uniref:Hydrophobin n=1 Tax=Fusarium longipes TaxID=694270 RepID=A0A395SXE1_9HYPO|nr:hypothetical protein FLONG3_4648 [Fusarium longipes]
MKATVILTLPILALAAATPQKVEERQLGILDNLPLNTECLRKIVNIDQCLPNVGTVTGNPFIVGDILGCASDLTEAAYKLLLGAALGCIRLPGLPVKE